MKNTITVDQIEKYNQMVEASIGTDAYNRLALVKEYREDDTKRWIGNPYGYLYPICDCFKDAEYYIKTVKGRIYLYMDLGWRACRQISLGWQRDCKAFLWSIRRTQT